MSEAMDLDPNTIITEKSIDPTSSNPNLIKPWHILAIAGIAIASWIGFAIWIMLHNPSESERATIVDAAQTFATAGFFYYLGSSAGSRNKDHQ
jgi:hypothetical protein